MPCLMWQGVVLLLQAIDDGFDVLHIFRRQPFQLFRQVPQRLRLGGFEVEEFAGRDVQVFADVEKHSHGREGFAVFDVIDVVRVLPDG